MQFLDEIFERDCKNYHAWGYRIWLVERFQLWSNEMKLVERLMEEDATNNSIWSYRNFLLYKSPTGTYSEHEPGTLEFVNEEIQLIK